MNQAITSGPIWPVVLRLAWPVIVAEALHTAFHIVDTVWVGGLGTDATAALTTSMFVVWIILALASLVNTGLTAHVSQAIGAGDRERAGAVVAQGLYLALILGGAVALVGWITAPWIFAAIGAAPAVAEIGTAYVRVLSLGSVASFLYLGAAAVMRAAGDTRTPLKIIFVSVVANAALAPLFIYTLGLGVTGAALATLLCQAAAVAMFARLRGSESFPFARRPLDRAVIRQLAVVGTPYCFVISLFSLVYLVFAAIAAPLGAAAMAVVGVANRLESICYLMADGFAAAAATVVGQNLGAGDARRAARGAWSATGAMAACAAVLTVVFLVFPRELFTLFTRDAATIELGATYLRILAICQIATGVEGVLAGAFAGAGDTVPPLVIHAATSLLRVPLAFVLVGAGWGLGGIAWTITVTCLLRSGIMTWWFARGRWARRRLGVATAAEVAYARGA